MDLQRPRFIPWSVDTQLSATVDAKQDDRVDFGNRLLHQLTMHIPAMSSTHVMEAALA